jgi:hypothetical protein
LVTTKNTKVSDAVETFRWEVTYVTTRTLPWALTMLAAERARTRIEPVYMLKNFGMKKKSEE